jgi:hypothetical protein
MAEERYNHTQIGWVLLLSLGVATAIIVPIVMLIGLTVLSLIVLGIMLVVLAMFATLTVTVDDENIAFRFGIGLIRKRIALADVRHYGTVRNRWYYGWGIRFYPGGTLYNVSGLGALEIYLRSGTCLRIGTDEPEALREAVERRIGVPEPLSPQEVARARRSAWKAIIIIVAIALAIVGTVTPIVFLEGRPPAVTIGPETFRVDGVMYGEEFPLSDITAASLEERIPRIRLRTNGYAAGGKLRGHFRLDELGDGQLFINVHTSPYVLVRTYDTNGTLMSFRIVEKADGTLYVANGETITGLKQGERPWQFRVPPALAKALGALGQPVIARGLLFAVGEKGVICLGPQATGGK